MNALDWAGWKLLGARNRLADAYWEWRLDIRTDGRIESRQPDANRYETFCYVSILEVLARLEAGSEDVVVDIGCGKGRVLCCAALEPVRKVVGVDIDRELCEAARENAARLRGRRANVEIAAMPAQEFDYADCTVCVMFNPFGAQTLAPVLESIGRSLRERPRDLRLAYVNPVHESLLRGIPGFERFDLWERAPWTGLKQSVSFWRFAARTAA